tara:strand:- start:41 stop:217 length:177 start_codon:yes stop_codon:yes gene_type:complete
MPKKKLTKAQGLKARNAILANLKKIFNDKFDYGTDSVVKMSLSKVVDMQLAVTKMISK